MPTGSRGPEPWEVTLGALWDALTRTREQQGAHVAHELAQRALQAVRPEEPKKETHQALGAAP